MASEGTDFGRPPLSLLLALAAAGLAGNYLNFPVFPSLDYLFGSIFSLLILQFFGLGRGIAATVLISSSTLILWHHPYAMLSFTAEAAVVGWLVLRRRMGMLLADTLFWLLIGMPLVYLFYRGFLHRFGSEVGIYAVKQAINGIANALVARLLFTAYAVRTRKEAVSFRDITYNLLAVFVLFPALILLAVSGRSDFSQVNRGIQETLARDTQRVSSNLEQWVEARKSVLVHLAQLATTLTPEQMQDRLEQARGSDHHFLRIALLNREAVTTAHAPSRDERGQSNLGKSFADRPFLPQLQAARQPMLSELVQGTIDSDNPRVLILVPVLENERYAGYLAGVINLERVRDILQQALDHQEMRFTLVDKNGRVIISNREDQRVMTPFSRGEGTLTPLPNRVSLWTPTMQGTAWERWKRSAFTMQSKVGSFSEWSLILEQPVHPFLSGLFERYSQKLALLFLIFLGSLVFAELLSRLFQARFAELCQTTSDLPARLAQGQEIVWPDRPVLEVRELMENFKDITASLTAQIRQTRELNENLEQRVASRTAELSSLNRDFLNFLENSSDFIYYKDQDSRFRFCSQALATLTGHARWRDLIGRNDREVFPEDLARRYLEEDEQIFREGVSLLNKVSPYCDAQGQQGWISTNKWPVFDASGKVVGIFGISRDITNMMQIQESLLLAQQSLNQVPDPIMWVDPAGQIVDCNEGACQCLGYGYHELLECSIFEIDPLATRESWGTVFAELRGERSRHFESTYLTRDGRVIPMDVQVAYICFGDKEYLCGVARDLSERKHMEEQRLRLERQALHVQKLESLGVLSGGIAHDFNNLLQVVLGNLDLGLMKLPENAAIRKNLEQAVMATVRASELSGMMLAYSGKGVLSVKKLDLSALVRENADLLDAVIAKQIGFTPQLAPGLPPVQADATQVLQVILNLVRNASEAIGGDSGSITLSTGVDEFDQAALGASRLEEKLLPGRYVWMEIRDTGCGMDEATQYKSFDPFFTTKFTGRGLGMSAALGIMRAHKGAIMLESELGAGTTVRLLFPIAAEQAPVQPLESGGEAHTPSEGERRETVLVVDDEEMVRTLAIAMLQAFGFETIAASDGDQALEIFRREGSRIALVMLDQNMPTMDGLTVFKELRRLSPEIKVLLASGYSEKEVAARFRGLDLNGFIQKPYNVKHLMEEINRVLEKTSAG